MKIYRLTFEQKLPISLDEAWDYFSSPYNLAEITPSDMSFVVTSPLLPSDKMYPGLIINYKVSPLFGIKLNWTTEITHCYDKHYFVDEQRFGPFAFWHHLHRFESVDGGVIMHDVLHYAIGFGLNGTIVNKIIVSDKINSIFNFRKQKISDLFG